METKRHKPMAKKKQHIIAFSMALLVLSVKPEAQPLHADLISIGLGTWISFSANQTQERATYFNKLPASMYLSFAGFKAYAGIPVLWTIQTKEGVFDDQLVRVADMHVYLGRRIGIVEPRIGAKFPTGYRTDRVWIGTRNVRLQAGLALNSTVRETEDISISAETMFDLYLPGSSGKAHWFSWELLPSFKSSIRVHESIRIGLEILAHLKNVYWSESWDELSAGAVPNIYTEFKLSPSLYFTPKFGLGPTFKKAPADNRLYHKGYSINISLALNIYP